MARKKAIVSACLLGERVRYDGKSKENLTVRALLEGYEIIPFCPEDPVMGTPRGRISVIKENNRYKLITDEDSVEVTTAIILQTQMVIDLHRDADIVVLKSKSPSCGLGTTPILNPDGVVLEQGDGIAADLFREHFKKRVYDELSLKRAILTQKEEVFK